MSHIQRKARQVIPNLLRGGDDNIVREIAQPVEDWRPSKKAAASKRKPKRRKAVRVR